MAMIEMDRVEKRFDDFTALRELTISVPEGAVYGLVGPNGAGKTTAIRHITGYLAPDSGEVRMAGESVYDNAGIKSRFFCIPDEPYAFPSATTGEMMELTRRLYQKFDSTRYEKLHEIFPFSENRPLRRLSKGMRKQAAFRLALAARPEVLILDEPVDGLDPVMRRQIWSLVLGDVAEYGMTVLVSSHNLRELEDVCDHVGILNAGKCIREHNMAELQDNMVKLLVALPEGGTLPEGLDILHRSETGRLQTLILRGERGEIMSRIAACSPEFLDSVPLSLEEVFIYEMGGVDYEVRSILL